MQKISIKQKTILIIFGLFLSIVLLEIGLRIGGFVFLSLQEYRSRISIKQRGTYRIMCLGESTTALGGKDSYPSQLQEILNQRDIGIKFSVVNKGIVGTDTRVIMLQLEDNLDKYSPNTVITMMGINDGEDTIAYEDIPVKKTILFMKSFRTYKLIRLLWQHIINKVKEIEISRPKENVTTCRANDLTPSSYNSQEKLLKEPIAITPSNYQTYIRSGKRYMAQKEYGKAEEILKKAIEMNPGNDEAYFELGWCYIDQGKYNKAEKIFRKTIIINPGNDKAYIELGWCYNDQGKYDKAEEIFKKTIEINQENNGVYAGLGCCYTGQEKYNQAEEMLKKAIGINPGNDEAYINLGCCYMSQEKYEQAEGMFKKAIEVNPKNDWIYFQLGWYYRNQGKYDQAEEILQEAIEINPKNDKVYNILALLYEEQGKNKSAEEYLRKVNRLRLESYNPATRRNYQGLKEMVIQRGIRLVCVQYPMRGIEPLKKMFNNKEGIIFVDNERIFKEAVKHGRYDEYFMDKSGGDFGHCTRKGNKLLAENIADVILKEYFK